MSKAELSRRARVPAPWLRSLLTDKVHKGDPARIKRVSDELGLDYREMLALTDQLGEFERVEALGDRPGPSKDPVFDPSPLGCPRSTHRSHAMTDEQATLLLLAWAACVPLSAIAARSQGRDAWQGAFLGLLLGPLGLLLTVSRGVRDLR